MGIEKYVDYWQEATPVDRWEFAAHVGMAGAGVVLAFVGMSQIEAEGLTGLAHVAQTVGGASIAIASAESLDSYMEGSDPYPSIDHLT